MMSPVVWVKRCLITYSSECICNLDCVSRFYNDTVNGDYIVDNDTNDVSVSSNTEKSMMSSVDRLKQCANQILLWMNLQCVLFNLFLITIM
jgi:hypothetical protein